MPKKKVVTMAIPPAVGVGVLCDDLLFGVSIILERCIIFQHNVLEKKTGKRQKQGVLKKQIKSF